MVNDRVVYNSDITNIFFSYLLPRQYLWRYVACVGLAIGVVQDLAVIVVHLLIHIHIQWTGVVDRHLLHSPHILLLGRNKILL